MKDVILYLKKLLSKDDKIVIACSGGPDSMCLLSLVQKVQASNNCTLICAHINHNKRMESKEEAEYVKNYCSANNIIYEFHSIENYSDGNFHNEARKIRYDFFESVIKKHNANYLMTAHHADDLMETILMRITRGSTLKGYAGFEHEIEKENYKLIRPLITITKEEIIKYNEENNIDFFVDKSNYEDKYTRNRYRNKIIPFLKSEDKQVHQKFLKFHNALLEYDNYINHILDKEISNIFNNSKINLKEFNKLDNFIQTKIIERILKEFYLEDLFLINDSHLELIINLAKNSKANNKVNLPNNIIAKKTYDEIIFSKEKLENDQYEIIFEKEINLPNHSVYITNEDDDSSNFCLRLNSEEIKMPLTIRTRKNGDWIEVKNLNGHKKVNDIFIDEKISIAERNSWPIIIDNNKNILWIPGIKKSKFDKEKHEKYDIILKCKKER